MAKKMTRSEIRSFMGSGSRTGKLATVCEDGRPHVAPIWFDFDEATGDIVFLTATESVKGRNLVRDGRASLLVDDEEMPFSFAKVDGAATLSEDADELLHWATATCRRYVGADRAEEFGRRNAVAGEMVVRLTPTSLSGYTGIAD